MQQPQLWGLVVVRQNDPRVKLLFPAGCLLLQERFLKSRECDCPNVTHIVNKSTVHIYGAQFSIFSFCFTVQ